MYRPKIHCLVLSAEQTFFFLSFSFRHPKEIELIFFVTAQILNPYSNELEKHKQLIHHQSYQKLGPTTNYNPHVTTFPLAISKFPDRITGLVLELRPTDTYMMCGGKTSQLQKLI
jgi:hypothetical protein